MTSFRNTPPMFPPPLEGDDSYPTDGGNIVRLRDAQRREGDILPAESDEPVWRQAFIVADGVKATRTPDRVIRARNGFPEPPPPGSPRHARHVDDGQPHTIPVIEEAEEHQEPAVRAQLAELREKVAPHVVMSDRIASLANREASMPSDQGLPEVSPRLMIEKASRVPGQAPRAEQAPAQQPAPPTETSASTGFGTSFSMNLPAATSGWGGLGYLVAGLEISKPLPTLPAPVRETAAEAAAEADERKEDEVEAQGDVAVREAQQDTAEAPPALDHGVEEPEVADDVPRSVECTTVEVSADPVTEASPEVVADASIPLSSGTADEVETSHEAEASVEEIDLGYLALYEDLVPTVAKASAVRHVAVEVPSVPVMQETRTASVDAADGEHEADIGCAIASATETPDQVPAAAACTETSEETADAEDAQAEPMDDAGEMILPDAERGEGRELLALPAPVAEQTAARIVDLPRTGPTTFGEPLAARAEPQAWAYRKPDIAFLTTPPGREGPELTEDILEETAGKLEKVIRDFGVKGEVIHVHPGPVVTLYEFEPAPGIKSSRVIALTEDIARSMSAISARVAVIPGRNAIGIELPNEVRETVYLRELLETEDFETSKHKLPLCLGKTIGGESVIADLARMPHLLVAGTTGSGKSVAINTMILSLLYRFTPEECRLIMVDPKMLELSVYDGIPHLLTPVVTDPKKAIIALRWAVREMEERYKKMAKLGVRNIDGFNARVHEAKARGEVITRTVQTGFDKATGELTYEEEVMDLSPLPYVVVIVDEMADLMMVAGKEIEGAIQRLAQMARAAGIHVILATQRPSVDVITGTIKANFPTRISFQVTSKIDSRTILGETGAEQLLGQGDMLHMQGGGRIARVHGPFVSDEEVERVVGHLKRQAKPVYLDAVTAEDDDEEEADEAPVAAEMDMDLGTGEVYDQAVSIVLRHKKASTSYIQRRLQIGYNRAASIMERMEKEGVVGPANHAGKREILIGTGGIDEE